MLRSAIVVLAIFVVLGSFSPSSAFARDGDYGGAAGSRGNNFCGGLGGTPGAGYGHRASGSRGELRGYEGCDVWGHWGAYYGPLIPMI